MHTATREAVHIAQRRAGAGKISVVVPVYNSHASKYTNVPVRHEPRRFGSSNYNFKRSVKLSANLLLSYSSVNYTIRELHD